MTLPLWTLSPLLLGIIDTLLWFTLHMLIAWGGTIIPARKINGQWFLFRAIPGEKKLLNFLGIKHWKDLVPDGARWFSGGFAKASIKERTRKYYKAFFIETCRGELVHWLVICMVPLFFLFNPRSVWWIHVTYALFANIPCILIQRYNRPRLLRLMHREQGNCS